MFRKKNKRVSLMSTCEDLTYWQGRGRRAPRLLACINPPISSMHEGNFVLKRRSLSGLELHKGLFAVFSGHQGVTTRKLCDWCHINCRVFFVFCLPRWWGLCRHNKRCQWQRSIRSPIALVIVCQILLHWRSWEEVDRLRCFDSITLRMSFEVHHELEGCYVLDSSYLSPPHGDAFSNLWTRDPRLWRSERFNRFPYPSGCGVKTIQGNRHFHTRLMDDY